MSLEPTPEGMESVAVRADLSPWRSYADWMMSGDTSYELVEHRTGGQVLVDLTLTRQRTAFADPPTPDLALVLVRAGGCEDVRVDFGHGRFTGTQIGQFVFAPAGHANNYQGGHNFELLNTSFPASALVQLAERTGLPTPDLGPLHAGPFDDEPLRRLVGLMWADATADYPNGSLYADGLFTAVSARLMTLAKVPLPQLSSHTRLDPKRIAKVEAYMRAHLADARSINADALADLAGYSRFHFDRLFKEATGLTPPQRLLALRLEMAMALLRDHPTWSVLAIALECGFSDQSHLSRRLREATGLTPTQWRRQA